MISTSPNPVPPAFHLLAKPTGAICNLDCEYCFFLAKELDHRQVLRRIKRGDFTYESRLSLTFVVAIALILVGLFAFIGILS